MSVHLFLVGLIKHAVTFSSAIQSPLLCAHSAEERSLETLTTSYFHFLSVKQIYFCVTFFDFCLL